MTALAVGLMLLIALAWALLWPARRRRAAPEAPRTNLRVLQDQLAALDAEFAEHGIDAEQHARGSAEIQRRVLEEAGAGAVSGNAAPAEAAVATRSVWVVGLAVPLLAIGLYAALGRPDAANAPPPLAAASAPGGMSMQTLEAMVDKLAARLAGLPDGDPSALKGWTMLGRSYVALQRLPEARQAYARALSLAPDDARLLTDQAEVIALLQDRRLGGEPMQLIDHALRVEPTNLKALALAGSDAYERQDFAVAIAYWSRARQAVPADSEAAAGLDRSIEDARNAAGLPAPAASSVPRAAAGSASSPPAAGLARVSGRVTLAPALATRVAPGDSVFIFARAEQGPRMPLAILRRTAGELPITFTLDDSLAMSPELKLSGFGRVVIAARISRSGNAMPQAGDLVAGEQTVSVGAQGVQLVIDGVRP